MSSVIQWQPWQVVDAAVLEALPDRHEQVREVVAASAQLTLAPTTYTVYLPGVNIDGGEVDLDIEGPLLIAVAGGDPSRVLADCAAVAELVRPARLIVRDGADAWAVALDGQCRIDPLTTPWSRYLTEVGVGALAYAELVGEAQARAADGELAAALALSEEAIAVDPQRYAGLALRGWLLNELGRFDEAEQACRQAITADERSWVTADSYRALGYAMFRLGRTDEAVAACRQACDASRTPGRVRDLGVTLMHTGQVDEARDLFRSVLRGEIGWFVDAAEAVFRLDQHDLARGLLQAALDVRPELAVPVPDNVRPKSPDLSWATNPAMAGIVAAARRTARASARASARTAARTAASDG